MDDLILAFALIQAFDNCQQFFNGLSDGQGFRDSDYARHRLPGGDALISVFRNRAQIVGH